MELSLSLHKFRVEKDTPLGRGCIATEKIKKNEIICKFIGPLINSHKAIEKYGANFCTPFQIDKDEYIDLIEPYVCFNHSCLPNAGVRNDGILFALEDIKKGQEIFYDYSTTVDDITWTMNCLCGNDNCRKVVGDFQSVPHTRKQFYVKNKALTNHLFTIFY